MRQEPSDAPMTPLQVALWNDRMNRRQVIDRTSSHDERGDRDETIQEDRASNEREYEHGTQSRHVRR